MAAILCQLALLGVFGVGLGLLLQPLGQQQRFARTLDTVQVAGMEYIGAHCARGAGQGGLPATASLADLQTAGNLPAGFDAQGTAFTWNLAAHPAVSMQARGNEAQLRFLATRTLGGFAPDGSYTFIPHYATTLFRAANNSYNLFAYDAYTAACDRR